jgi:hypothetical protein
MTDPIITLLNGFSAFAVVCAAWTIGIVYIYICRKKNTRVLASGVIIAAAIALGLTGITISFLSVAIFGYNLPWVKGVISYFSYSTLPIGAIAMMYTSWDVTGSPKNKKYMLIGFLIYNIVYYIILFTPSTQTIMCPEVPRGEIYDDWVSSNSPLYYLIYGEVLIVAIISAIGFNKFRKTTPGDLKKRSNYILLALPIIGICILLDTVILTDAYVNYLFIARFLLIFGHFLLLLGFRPS